MATELGQAKSKVTSKHDTFVASQLKQAETRIRMLDMAAGLLGFAGLSLAYIVSMVVCDSWILLSQHTRQLSLYAFLAGSAAYLYFAVLRPLRLRVNPYFAARQVEQQLPHAKNSIVNWVDLHEQPLPPAIRGALGQRAAKDLAQVDLERVISGRRTAWTGGLAGLFAFAFIVSFFLLGPAPFVSLLKRTFNPFEAVGVSTRTRLTLLKPEGGNATVTVGRGINFVVDVSGKVPNPKAADAVKLLYRCEEGDPWQERRLIQETSGDWTASLSAIEVRNGFWYKITGGDAATEEYRVSVRAAAAITDFLAKYRFRPYAAHVEELRRERDLKALRGTEVLLRVRTNRTLRDGRLEFESNNRAEVGKPLIAFVRGEVDANEPNTLLVRYVLDEDGKYRLNFTSTDGEAYRDAVSYPVTAIPDQPPTVELTKPGKDIRLPVDALLHLEGKVGDDIGVKSVTLRMRVVGGEKLQGQPYRYDEKLRLADGGYPCELEYKDFVELSRVRSEDGRVVQLRAGMELEYWLEAMDACDYPHPNVTESKRFRVQLTEPEKNDLKKNQERKRAEKEKKQHEQKQDQKLQKENQQRKQQQQEQQANNKAQENKGQNADKNGAGEKSQTKEGGQTNNTDGQENKDKENNGQQGESKAGSGEANSGDQKNDLSNEDQKKIEDQIKKALQKQQAGENKPDKNNAGEEKGTQQNKLNGSEGASGKSEGENKNSAKENAGQARAESSKGDGKGDKNESKGSDPKNQTAKPGEGEDKPGAVPKSRENKSGGDSQSSQQADQSKENPKDQGQSSAKDGNKSAEEKRQQSQGATGRKEDGKPQGEKKEERENKQHSGSAERKATDKEIADLARALNSSDAREREKAKQQLQRLAKDAGDAESRKQAGEALEKEGKQDSSAGKDAPKNDSDSPGKASGERKQGEKSDSTESTESSKDKGDGKNANPGEKSGQNGKKRPGSSPYEGQQGSPISKDGTPGGGGDQRIGNGDSGVPPSQPKQPDKPRDHRAAQMQLEDFAKRVNKGVLKEAGVSEEAWKKYLAAKRKELTATEKPRPELPIAPQQAKQLPNMGGRTIQSAASAQDDAQSPNRGQPPPGYRDSFRKFTQQMSKDK